MAELLSRLDYFEIGRRFVRSRAKRIDPALVDFEGTDVNLFVGSMSFVAASLSRQLADRISALFLDGADGEDLDRYAFDRYQQFRKGAAPAVGRARFFRASSAAGLGSIPIGTKVVSLTGIEYVTTTQASFAAGQLGDPVNGPFANVRAVQAGKDFQVGANQIRRFDNVGLLFDASLQVNNDLPTAGGENVEEDGDFRERVRDFWNTARRGTLSAIEFGARTVPGVVSAQAVEALTSTGQPARVVNLFIADSSGVASAAMGAAVSVALLEYRAAGIAVIISTSIPLIVDIKQQLVFVAGVDTAVLTENIRAAEFEFVNSLPVNGPLYRAALFSLLQRFASDGLIVKESSIIEPAGDIVPPPGRTLRTRLDNITAV